MASQGSSPVIKVQNLSFDYGGPPILKNINLELPKGSRTLLVGANGTGKSTLLRLIAGKHIHEKEQILVLGYPAFHQTPSTLTFLGGEWASNPNVRKDVSVRKLIESVGGSDALQSSRCIELLQLLDIDINWRMHIVSDGERRRVQILLGLMNPFDVLLLDEVTVDLDVLVRADLLNFLKHETEVRGSTILYATHIFDGLNEWPTHMLHLRNGRVFLLKELNLIEDFHQIKQNKISYNSPLLQLVEKWLREELVEKRKNKSLQKVDDSSQSTVLQTLAASTLTDRYYNYWN